VWTANGTTWTQVGGVGGGVGEGAYIPPVVVASTFATEMTNSPPNGTATIDGVAVVSGWRVLLTAQTVPTDNGVWIANTAGDWTRPADFVDGTLIFGGTTIGVGGGTFNAYTEFMVNGNTTIGTFGVYFILNSSALRIAGQGTANFLLALTGAPQWPPFWDGRTFEYITNSNSPPGTGGGFPAIAASITIPPTTVAAAGQIITAQTTVEVKGIDTTNDIFHISLQVIISNADGSEQLWLLGGEDAVVAGPNQDVAINTSNTSVNTSVGSDLSYDTGTGIVSSAAGGTYSVVAVATGAWD
jgi:hypothetical protein